MKVNQKLYCFVDETGLDVGSKYFIVAAVIVVSNISSVRERLHQLENRSGIGRTKWHKSNYKLRIKFMEEFLLRENKDLRVYFMKARKPILYYVPTLEILQKAISANNNLNIQAIVCIDGLDKLGTKKFTNALRTKVLKIRLAKGVRDESEALIRLADRWAGCVRMALFGNERCKNIVAMAEKLNILMEV